MEISTGGLPSTDDPGQGLFGQGLSQRACLAPLFTGELQTPKERLTWIEQQLVKLAQSVAAAKAELARSQAQNRQTAWQIYVERYQICCFLVYVETHGLWSLRQCRSLAGYVALFGQLWPGEKITDKQFEKYLDVARRVSEPVGGPAGQRQGGGDAVGGAAQAAGQAAAGRAGPHRPAGQRPRTAAGITEPPP